VRRALPKLLLASWISSVCSNRFRTDVFDEPVDRCASSAPTGEAYEGELKFHRAQQTLGLRIALLSNQARSNDDLREPCVSRSLFEIISFKLFLQ